MFLSVLDYDINVDHWPQSNRLNFNNIVNRLFCAFTTTRPLPPQAIYAREADQCKQTLSTEMFFDIRLNRRVITIRVQIKMKIFFSFCFCYLPLLSVFDSIKIRREKNIFLFDFYYFQKKLYCNCNFLIYFFWSSTKCVCFSLYLRDAVVVKTITDGRPYSVRLVFKH